VQVHIRIPGKGPGKAVDVIQNPCKSRIKRALSEKQEALFRPIRSEKRHPAGFQV
jgi:hypothetical protein